MVDLVPLRTAGVLLLVLYLCAAGWFFILVPWSRLWSTHVVAGAPLCLLAWLDSPALRGALSGFGVLHFLVAATWGVRRAAPPVIAGLGLDVVAVARVAGLLARHGERLLARCFAAGEVRRPADAEHVAGLLAAKEAAFKALGTGWAEGVGWRDVVVARDEGGAPRLELHGAARARGERLAVRRAHLAISHAAGLAVAVVVLEANRLDGPASPL